MTTDPELQAFFAARAGRVEALRAQYRAGWPASVGGCSIGCLLPFAMAIAFIVRGKEWAKLPYFLPAAIGAGLVALSLAAIGLWLYQRGQKAFAPVDAAVDAELLRPLASLFVEGATLAHPDDSILEWRASLLFPRSAHVHSINGQTTRIAGRLAGLPMVLDELFIRYRHSKNSSTFGGWVVRLELPFAVGGHLRIRTSQLGSRSLLWQGGFAPHHDATARLATGHEVEAAAPGVTPEGAGEPTLAGVPVESLLTDSLLDLLRANRKVQVAAVAQTLFVVVPNVRAFDNRRSVALFDAGHGRKTAQRFALVEAIAREVGRAGARSGT